MSKMQMRKSARRAKRKARVRGKVSGTAERPRLTVSRSLKNISAQVIDDEQAITLAYISTDSKSMAEKLAEKNKTQQAELVGEEIAKAAKEKGVEKVSFDRNGYVYHGRVKALAEAARKAGLDF